LKQTDLEQTDMIATVLIAAVALIHVYIVVLEMLLWDTPRGRKAFGTTAEFSARTKTLAANQGLYNGFLVAGLAWGLWLGAAGLPIKVFFLGCIILAGLYGAATANVKILYIQAVPAGLALLALMLAV
jgi:putative membrane protein